VFPRFSAALTSMSEAQRDGSDADFPRCQW
jgi:hypothetical protein